MRGEAFGGFSLAQSLPLTKLPVEPLEVILGSDSEVMRRTCLY